MTRQQGEIAELYFQYLASKEGLIVSTPHCTEAYDFIVDHGGNLQKVQVKSTSVIEKGSDSAYRFNLAKGCRKKKKYLDTDVDVFALHIIPLDLWYFIPFDLIKGKLSFRVYPYNNNENFFVYRYNWDSFRSMA